MENNIRAYRNIAKLTQQQLADLVGARRETIGNLEAGRYNPSLNLAYKITSALNNASAAKWELTIMDIFPPAE